MKDVDKTCLDAFPEMLEFYGQETLKNASEIGSYVFFEDYFNEFIDKHKSNDQLLQRAANYIEGLAQADDQDIQNLTEIGILEGLVNRQVHKIAKYLKPHSKKLLNQATSRTKIDKGQWRLDHYSL